MTQKELLTSWLNRAKTVEKAHFEFSLLFQRHRYVWGGLLISSPAFTTALTAVAENHQAFPNFGDNRTLKASA